MDRSPARDFDEILARARAGDEAAWTELYDSLAPQLLGYLRVRGARDAESLVGDVFFNVARSIDTFVGTAAGFRSWVFVIATSRLYDERRRHTRKPTEPLGEILEERLRCTDDVEAEVEQSAAADAAADLLSILTPDQRRVVALRVFGELTSAEVAEIVGKPLSAVKALYRRGLAALRRELVDDEAAGRATDPDEVDDLPVSGARELLSSSASGVSFSRPASVTERS